MAEESDLKSLQCGFESHHGYMNKTEIKIVLETDLDVITAVQDLIAVLPAHFSVASLKTGLFVTFPRVGKDAKD